MSGKIVDPVKVELIDDLCSSASNVKVRLNHLVNHLNKFDVSFDKNERSLNEEEFVVIKGNIQSVLINLEAEVKELGIIAKIMRECFYRL